ncbi:LOW QUALITY PROTEIN: erythroferrone-like [Gymnogyps californianus]|uniref:LOW QUALITY PROTEIN: erythroferrone-like n=1 Tax=Gymnogyps californianus TaxID=33616 RepID=UPI0021C9587B|nr:LOW QUALITY PROTEIN: erythroferrone-like [Gymnogyps californianus]
MRLRELCLALLCAAAAAGTGSPGAAREHPPVPGAAAGRAAETGRGGPGAAARAGGVDPRQAWMLLAGSPGRTSGSRARGRTGTPVLQVGVRGGGAAPAPAVLEELLRELHLLLKGMVKEQAKTRRKAWEGREEEEESGESNPQARSHRRVEAAFHCRTRENISIEQRARQELRLYYIPEREGMFHRGLGLNLTSGQYTAPIAGYYTFTATLHIVRREQRRKGQPCRGNRLRVLICVQSHCQHNSNLETVSWLESGGDLFTISVTGVLYLQAGQYASVFVDNAAGSPLTVQSGSDFSAILLGV